VQRPRPFFRGSELPRLLVLAALALCGWVFVWHLAQEPSHTALPPAAAAEQPDPVVADDAPEFETVTDRTPMSFRDNAAYSLLLERARGKTPGALAADSRRDVVLAHLWQTPELYRGVPMHLEGNANRIIRYPATQSPNRWLYEAWVFTPDAPKVPFVCVFEDAPHGLPIGPAVSERVVFNGYFLKLMKYQAGDVARGAPVLIGRIGWLPPPPASLPGSAGTMRWTLVALAILFCISLVRWALPLRRLFSAPGKNRYRGRSSLNHPRDIDSDALDAWVAEQQPLPAKQESGTPDAEGDSLNHAG
jgi:hypothetical protein